jgi:hypothetical protein
MGGYSEIKLSCPPICKELTSLIAGRNEIGGFGVKLQAESENMFHSGSIFDASNLFSIIGDLYFRYLYSTQNDSKPHSIKSLESL